MTEEQKRARSILQKEREEMGLSGDMDGLIEEYRAIDPEYAAKLEEAIGPPEKASRPA